MHRNATISIVTVPELVTLAKSVHQIMAAAGFNVRKDVVLAETRVFADGETLTRVRDTIRRTEVFFFFAAPEHEPERGRARLEDALNAIHHASPIRVNLVMPYMFFARQDRKSERRAAMTIQNVASAITQFSSVRGLFTFDLHAQQIQLAFKIPVDDLWGLKLLAEQCSGVPGWTSENVAIVAPDIGSVKRAKKFADKSGFPLIGIINKLRTNANEASVEGFIGDPDRVAGKTVIFPDDMVDTGGTIIAAWEAMRLLGAARGYVYATHWLASPKEVADEKDLFSAEQKFIRARLNVVTTNTIPRKAEYLETFSDILTVIPCDYKLASAIMKSLTPEESVSELFD